MGGMSGGRRSPFQNKQRMTWMQSQAGGPKMGQTHSTLATTNLARAQGSAPTSVDTFKPQGVQAPTGNYRAPQQAGNPWALSNFNANYTPQPKPVGAPDGWIDWRAVDKPEVHEYNRIQNRESEFQARLARARQGGGPVDAFGQAPGVLALHGQRDLAWQDEINEARARMGLAPAFSAATGHRK